MKSERSYHAKNLVMISIEDDKLAGTVIVKEDSSTDTRFLGHVKYSLIFGGHDTDIFVVHIPSGECWRHKKKQKKKQ